MLDEAAVVEAPVVTDAPAATQAIEKPATPGSAPPADESYADKLAAQERELDDDLRQVFRKATGDEPPPRAEDGKFASKTPAEVAPVVEAPKPVEVPKFAPPASMPKELAEKFAAAPPEVQKFIADREAESHKAISQLGRQVKSLEPVSKILEQNRATFERNGASYEQGVAALIAAQNALDQNPENGIAYLAQTYGIDLRGLVAKIYGQADNGLGPDPEVLSLKSEIAQMKRQAEFERTQQTARERAATETRATQERMGYESKIEAFAKDKPDFYSVAPEVLANIAAIQQTSPGLSPEDLLSQAYERAIWANPKTREAQQKAADAKRMAEAAKQATDAKRAGSINVRSSPKTAEPGSMDEDLRAIYRKNHAR